MKTQPSADKQRVKTVITRIAEDQIRSEAPSLYPTDYSLQWCISAVKKYRIKLAIGIIVLFAIATLIEIGVWKLLTVHRVGWFGVAALIVIGAFSFIPLLGKMLSPGDKVEKLVFEVEYREHKFRQLGSEFVTKLISTSPDRKSLGGSSIQTLKSDARLAVQSVLVDQISKYLDMEGRGAFGTKRLRKKLGTLHKRAVALEIGIDKEIKTYFSKVPKVVVIHDLHLA
jgi:hypothetical protein